MGELCETGDYVASKRRHIQSCFRLTAPQRMLFEQKQTGIRLRLRLSYTESPASKLEAYLGRCFEILRGG